MFAGRVTSDGALMADIELLLHHDGRAWVAHGSGLTVRGITLAALDAALTDRLAALGALTSAPVSVFMAFDRDTLPGWLRQYHAHYFNRTVRLGPAGRRP